MGALSRRDAVVAAAGLLLSWTLATAWIATLRWLPYAFLAGAVSAASALLYYAFTSAHRLEGHGHVRPASHRLALTLQGQWNVELDALDRRGVYRRRAVFLSAPALSQSLETLLEYISRDFIKSWYSKITSGNAFPNEVDRSLRAALTALEAHTVDTDFADLAVQRLMPIVTHHLQSFTEAEKLARGKNAGHNITNTEELDMAIATRYRDGRIHPAASIAASRAKGPQLTHLRNIVGQVVPGLLPDKMVTSRAALVLVREIIVNSVLLPVLAMLSDPDTINQMIEAYGRNVLHDRKTVKKLRAALDEHAVPPKQRNDVSLVQLGPRDSEKAFERFIRTVRTCESLADAKRHRNEILMLLKRETASAAGDETFIRRLEVGRKLSDQRINQLSHQKLTRMPSALQLSNDALRSRETFSVREVLYDATGLSYFMEYMDRLSLTVYVQFWIVVDGFRNPLDGDDENDVMSVRQFSDAERREIGQIAETYLMRPELRFPQEAQSMVKSFLRSGKTATPAQFASAKEAILRAQSAIYEEMNTAHFQNFKSSDLYFKWVTSDPVRQLMQSNDLRTETSETDLTTQSPPATLVAPFGDISKPSTIGVPHLRRAVGSSSDLPSDSKSSKPAAIRRSLDDISQRVPLFDDEFGDDPMSASAQSLDLEVSPTEDAAAVDAVQAALDNLMEETPDNESLFADRIHERPSILHHHERDRVSNNPAVTREGLTQSEVAGSDSGKPSLSSLGLVGTPTRRTVFSEGDLFGENERFWEDEQGDGVTHDHSNDEDDIREAAPGDLGLAELIQALTKDIEKLEAQQSIVNSLLGKAELTNNTAELRILRKSKTSLEREIRRKELQRQQYIVQESDNTLYGRASLTITSVMVGAQADGHEYALYVIEVARPGTERVPGASWAVTRRYSEFYDLFKSLRRRFPFLRDMDFPRRQVVLTLQKDFLKRRRLALERFLQQLLTLPAVCAAIEFRSFLSQQAIRPIDAGEGAQVDQSDFVSRIYNSVTDGMEEFLGNIPVLDELSSAGRNLISAATSATVTSMAATPTTAAAIKDEDAMGLVNSMSDDPNTMAEAQAEIKAFDRDGVATAAEKEVTTFITPIADMFVELFQLHSGNNWLRGRAVVVVLQQLLGGTIERKVRESFRSITSETSLAGYVDMLVSSLWPGGIFRPSPAERTTRQMAESRAQAQAVMETLIGDLAGNVVGRRNATTAGRRLVTVLNNRMLNESLMFEMLDEMIEGVFEIRVRR